MQEKKLMTKNISVNEEIKKKKEKKYRKKNIKEREIEKK